MFKANRVAGWVQLWGQHPISAAGTTPVLAKSFFQSRRKDTHKERKDRTGTKLSIFLNTYVPQLPGGVMAKGLCHCISENFCFLRSQWGWCRMFCVTQVSTQGIGGNLWLFTVFLPLQPSPFCYTPDSERVSPFFSATPSHFHHGGAAFLLITCVSCSLHAFSNSVKICWTSAGTLQSRKFTLQPQWKFPVHALCPHR